MDYQKLYRHMAIEHGLFLLDSQMEEIVDIVLEMHNEKPETCTMKTAMQEMFEELYAHSFEIPIGLLAKCEELMAKEKEQIIMAYNSGQQIPPFEFAEKYYNETYGDKK